MIKAIITKIAIPVARSRKGSSTSVTNMPAYEGGFGPARPAQTKITLDHFATADAARRVNNPQGGLKLRNHRSMFRAMQHAPMITDRSALQKHRARADLEAGMFLHDAAIEDIQDRLTLVNKAFTSPAIVTGFPEIWRSCVPNARIVADDEVLNLEQGAHDLVIHAMALHWANDPVGQIIQCRRALQPDGLFMSVAYGGQTLHELRTALAQAESDVTGGLSPRVVPMAEIRDMGALLQRAGLALPVADSEPLTVTYETPWNLMRDLRAMGEANALAGRLRQPTRRQVLIRAAEIYVEEFMTEGRIPATFELIYLLGWAPDASQPQPLRPGSAATRLADVLGAKETKLSGE